MLKTRRTRTLRAPAGDIWELVCDPHHLPRWWPRVSRVEDVGEDAFTEVMKTAKGSVVRADFRLVSADETTLRIAWEQQLEGTPFQRVLSRAETELSLQPAGAGTEVAIELRQSLAGFFPRFGGMLVKRAAVKTLDEALDGLERIVG